MKTKENKRPALFIGANKGIGLASKRIIGRKRVSRKFVKMATKRTFLANFIFVGQFIFVLT